MALTESSRPVKSAQRAFEIIDFVHEQDGADLAEITDHLGLAKSTVHSYVATLETQEYLVQNGRTYRLGLKFLNHGIAARNSRPISEIAGEPLRKLSDDTSLVAWLIVEEHGHAVYLRKETPVENQQTYGRVSKRADLHILAGGKAILAHLPDEKVKSILESYGLKEQTEHTITDEEELWTELEEIREHGYAISEHEAALGVKSVAAPILSGNTVLGAICVSGMSNQMEDDMVSDELPREVVSAATNLRERYDRIYG